MAKTAIGLFFDLRSINKAQLCRNSGISPARLSRLCNNPSTRLTVSELIEIANALNESSCAILMFIQNNE